MPPDAVAAARCELAADFIEDLRRTGARRRAAKKKLTTPVQAAGTSLTGLFGAGPAIAAAVLGDVRDVSRFPGRDHFAACNGTAPIEVSSGPRKICRLSRRGNRRLSHAVHMAAVTQTRCRHSKGRACHDKKLAEGKTRKEALRSLKRQVSNAIFACLQAGARRAGRGPGGQQGNGSVASAAGLHPRDRLFGKATPGSCHHPATMTAPRRPALPGRAELAVPRSLPHRRRRRHGSRWSARSEARTNDLEAAARRRPHSAARTAPAKIRWSQRSGPRAAHGLLLERPGRTP
jgi:transposase